MREYATQDVLESGWEAVVGSSGGVAVSTVDGLPAFRVLCPLPGLGLAIADHVIELHARNLAHAPTEHAFIPETWYASAAWIPEQVLRRPWYMPAGGLGECPAIADSQFEEAVIAGGDPSVVDYVLRLHNLSLLPIR